jgi:hypothetical protein
MNWMSKKDKQINFKRKFSDLNKIENLNFKNQPGVKENLNLVNQAGNDIRHNKDPANNFQNNQNFKNNFKVISKIIF